MCVTTHTTTHDTGLHGGGGVHGARPQGGEGGAGVGDVGCRGGSEVGDCQGVWHRYHESKLSHTTSNLGKMANGFLLISSNLPPAFVNNVIDQTIVAGKVFAALYKIWVSRIV